MNKFITKVARLALGLSLAAGVGVAIGSNKAQTASATEGDELAICQGTGSGYGTRRTSTDSHSVGWVLATGQSGYLGANNAANHNKVVPTNDDLPVVKGVLSTATTSTTGYYFYYTTTPISNVGSLIFSHTATSQTGITYGYVLSSSTAASNGSATWSQVSLSSSSTHAQGDAVSLSGKGGVTATFTFDSTQTSAMYYGFVIAASSYNRFTAGTITLKEGAISGGSEALSTTTAVTAANNKTTLDGTLNPADSVQLITTVTDENSVELTNPTITYSSSDTNVATVTQNGGLVTAVGFGTTTITASYGGVTDEYTASSDTINIIVSDPCIASDLDFPVTGQTSCNNYTSSWTASNNGYTFTIFAANNNFSDHIRIGRNNQTQSFPTITSPQISERITSVVMTFSAVNSNLINDAILKISANSDLSNATEINFKNNIAVDTITITIPNSTSAANLYYQIYFDIAGSGSNGSIHIDRIIFRCDPISSDPYAHLDSNEVDLKTNNTTTGVTAHVTIENCSDEEIEWSEDSSYIELQNSTTDTVTIKPTAAALALETTTNVTVSLLVMATGLGENDSYEASLIVHLLPSVGESSDYPYTVAQARDFIDTLGSSTSETRYVSGIISQIDSYNSTYHSITYWISDDGSTTDQLEVYSGKNLNGGNFTAVTDIEVGAAVIVKGNLKIYNSVYEFTSNNELASYTAPVHSDPTLTLNSSVERLYSGGSSVTVTASLESFAGDTATLSVDSGTPDYVNVSISGLTITLSAKSVGYETITIKAVNGGQTDSKELKVAVTSHAGTSGDPFTVADANIVCVGIGGADGVYVTGIVSQAAESLSNGSLTYYISDDGTTTNQFEVYKGKGLNGNDFTAVSDIAVNDEVQVYGNIVFYNDTTPEFASGSTLSSYTRPQAATYDVTYTAGTNGTGSYVHEDQNGGTYTLLPFASLSGISAASGYQFKSYTLNGVERDPGYQFTLSDDVSVTVNFEEGESNPTVTFDFATIASANNWENGEAYTDVTISPVTVTAEGGGNNGKWYTSGGGSWRMYSGGTVSISVANGSVISVTSTPSCEFTISNGVATFSPSARTDFTEIIVEYTASSAVSYTISYEANGGLGSMEDTVGAAPEVAACGFTAPQGLIFSKWNDADDGTGNDYAVGDVVYENITLYAIWESEVADPSVYFTKITSTSQIGDGKYVIAYEGLIFDGSLSALDAIQNTKAMDLENLLTSYFTISDGDVVSASGKYIGRTTDSNGFNQSDTDDFTNTVEIDGDGNLVITAACGAILRYNKTSGQERFRFYKSSSASGQQDIQLYRVNFDKVFEDAITCNENAGSHSFNMGIAWKDDGQGNLSLQNLYNTLSTADKGSLTSATLSKYDYIVGKYNPSLSAQSAYNDFMGRQPSPIGASRILLGTVIGENTNTIAIIVIISMVSVTAIGGYFFIRRRKEN